MIFNEKSPALCVRQKSLHYETRDSHLAQRAQSVLNSSSALFQLELGSIFIILFAFCEVNARTDGFLFSVAAAATLSSQLLAGCVIMTAVTR